LTIVSIERNVAETISFDAVINDFAQKGMQNNFLGEGQDHVM